jgi:hypothetical protein
MSKRSNLVALVVVGFMLLLPLSLALPSQLAGARKQSDGQVPMKQSNSQKIKCSSDAICLAKAINIICSKNSLCYIGYNAPFLMAVPH